MKKLLSVIISIALLAAGLTYAALADEAAAEEPRPHYASVSGEITAIEEYYGVDSEPVEGWYRLSIKDEDDNPATILVTDATVFPFDSELETGDGVTAYFPANMPMIMIYPPQYTAYVLAAGIPDAQSIKVDKFTARQDGPEGYLVSEDNTLAFTVGDDTAVKSADGKAFDGELDGLDLAVIYDVSTRSIPALTTPLEIIVIDHEEPDYTYEPLPEESAVELPDVADMPIIVDGAEISAPAAFVNENGTVMVPLRAIAEALGFTVGWSEATQTITLDDDIEIAIGRRSGTSAGLDVILADAPVLVDERTFVPLSFFKAVAGMNNAYVFEGQIVVERDGEIME